MVEAIIDRVKGKLKIPEFMSKLGYDSTGDGLRTVYCRLREGRRFDLLWAAIKLDETGRDGLAEAVCEILEIQAPMLDALIEHPRLRALVGAGVKAPAQRTALMEMFEALT